MVPSFLCSLLNLLSYCFDVLLKLCDGLVAVVHPVTGFNDQLADFASYVPAPERVLHALDAPGECANLGASRLHLTEKALDFEPTLDVGIRLLQSRLRVVFVCHFLCLRFVFENRMNKQKRRRTRAVTFGNNPYATTRIRRLSLDRLYPSLGASVCRASVSDGITGSYARTLRPTIPSDLYSRILLCLFIYQST